MSNTTLPSLSLWQLFKVVTVFVLIIAPLGMGWRWFDAKQRAYQARWGPGVVTNREHWPSQTREVLEAAEQGGSDELDVRAYRHSDGWGHAFFWKLKGGNDAKQRIIDYWDMLPLAPSDSQVQDFWRHMPQGWLTAPGPANREIYAWPGIGDASRFILLHDLDTNTLYFCDVYDF